MLLGLWRFYSWTRGLSPSYVLKYNTLYFWIRLVLSLRVCFFCKEWEKIFSLRGGKIKRLPAIQQPEPPLPPAPLFSRFYMNTYDCLHSAALKWEKIVTLTSHIVCVFGLKWNVPNHVFWWNTPIHSHATQVCLCSLQHVSARFRAVIRPS
jgi:hypothetical protein